MTDIGVTKALRDQLPADLDLARATITTWREVWCNPDIYEDKGGGYDYGVDPGDDDDTTLWAYVDDDAAVVIASGYIASEGDCEVECPDAESAAEAVQDYVYGGGWDGWDKDDTTALIHVYVWRRGYVLGEDGHLRVLAIGQEDSTLTIDPKEPECNATAGHDWSVAYSALDGTVIRESCSICGRYRVIHNFSHEIRLLNYQGFDVTPDQWGEAKSKPWEKNSLVTD